LPHEPKFQIGEVADAVGLSLRTIRHYDELGVVVPSARSAGGYRLYTARDIERFRFVKKLKPLGFTLEEVQTMVLALDTARAGQADAALIEQLEVFALMAEERIAGLTAELEDARIVASSLRDPAWYPGDLNMRSEAEAGEADQEANGSL
jgi:DNA-binding transcriptional MerR regulator